MAGPKNFNDTMPAAPGGSVNVKWQIDSAGNTSAYVSPGGSTITFVRETPSGTLNGTNQTFLLSFVPNPAASLQLFLNGVQQIAATDYSISSVTITYSVAPKATDLMVAEYMH